jgi:hypothetical protein
MLWARRWSTCGRRAAPSSPGGTLPAMTIEVPAAEVYALGDALRSQAGLAAEAAVRFGGSAPVGAPLQPAVDGFLECHRTAARALAGELDWLGRTVAAVADSWLDLDGSLLAPRGRLARR